MNKNQEYAANYAEYAMEQMERYGIPASVTLAQGILESSNGQSELSMKGNAHFGIKCTSEWLRNGGTYLVYTDDKPNEKFCTYESVKDSYAHHTTFLKENARYKACFELSPDDYKGWCQGLQQAGYASGNHYATSLQQIIERNGLDKYDKQVMEKMNSRETQYSFPLKRDEFMLVTSPFGMRTDPMDKTKTQMHKGIDIKTFHEGVLATESGGKVVNVNQNAQTAGGKSVTIEYKREDETRYQVSYLHLDSVQVAKGDVVHAGQQLGISGNTGSRTTGEHLHLSIKHITADGKMRDIDPAVYLADIADKGNIQTQLLHHGENLLAKYAPEEKFVNSLSLQSSETPVKELSVEDWMKKLLSSEDAGLGMGDSDPLMQMITTLYTGLMGLAMQFDGKEQEVTKEEQMQTATEACLKKTIDISTLLPALDSCYVHLSQEGKSSLEMTVKGQKQHHELTLGEMNIITKTLGNADLSEANKKQCVSSLVSTILAGKQMGINYDEGVEKHCELYGRALDRFLCSGVRV
jgi:hypothetical protein